MLRHLLNKVAIIGISVFTLFCMPLDISKIQVSVDTPFQDIFARVYNSMMLTYVVAKLMLIPSYVFADRLITTKSSTVSMVCHVAKIIRLGFELDTKFRYGAPELSFNKMGHFPTFQLTLVYKFLHPSTLYTFQLLFVLCSCMCLARPISVKKLLSELQMNSVGKMLTFYTF